MTALSTLPIEFIYSFTIFKIVTFRTLISSRPFELRKIFVTTLFRRKFSLKCKDRKAFEFCFHDLKFGYVNILINIY